VDKLISKQSCLNRAISWCFLFIGLVVYEEYGFIVSIVLVGTGALFRSQEEDKLILSNLYENRKWLVFSLVYFTALFIFVITDIRRFNSYPMIVNAIALTFPALVVVLRSNIKSCFHKRKR